MEGRKENGSIFFSMNSQNGDVQNRNTANRLKFWFGGSIGLDPSLSSLKIDFFSICKNYANRFLVAFLFFLRLDFADLG